MAEQRKSLLLKAERKASGETRREADARRHKEVMKDRPQSGVKWSAKHWSWNS